jgi:hypothetical protein
MASPKLPSIDSGLLLGKTITEICGPLSYEIANLDTLNEEKSYVPPKLAFTLN